MSLVNKNNVNQINKYNLFLASNNAFFMQKLEWGNVKKNWEHYPIYIGNKDKIIMSANCLTVSLPIIKKLIVYCPRGPVGNINDIENFKLLINEIIDIIGKKNICCIRFDPLINNNIELAKRLKSSGFNVRNNIKNKYLFYARHNMTVDLKQKTSDDVFSTFSKSNKRKIKQGEKSNLNISFSNNIDDLKRFYNLYVEMNERKKLMGRSFEYMKNFFNSFSKEEIKIIIVSDEEEDLASAIMIYYNNRVYYAYGATKTIKNEKKASYFLHWQVIKNAIEKKYCIYDMGVVNNPNIDDGVFLFKEGFCRENGTMATIGEIDYPVNNFSYFLFTKIIPVVNYVKKTIVKKLKK